MWNFPTVFRYWHYQSMLPKATNDAICIPAIPGGFSLKSCLLRCVWSVWTVYGKGRFLTCYMCLKIKLLCFHADQQLRMLARVVKNSPANAGNIRDMSLIPGWGRSPGGGHGEPPQCSCLENPMDRGALWATVHRVAKSRIWLKWLSTKIL